MAGRYKELDLICLTEEQIHHVRGVERALRQLVESCTSHLNTGLGVLIMRERRTIIRCDSAAESIERASKLVRELQGDLYDWIKMTNDVVVIHDEPSSRSRRIHLAVPCKILACPVSIGGDNVDGILVIVRHPDAPEFTSRDQNLLRAIAANASSILQTSYDTLTGLINRKEFEYLLESILSRERSRAATHCVLHVNLDELHIVGDSVSREARDEAIRQVALQLEFELNDVGPVARIGEDEFAVLVECCRLDQGWCIGEDIRRAISGLSTTWDDRPIKLTASVGVAQLSAESETVESALAAAKIACIAAKDRGRDRVAVYRHHDAAQLSRQHHMQAAYRIQQALRDDRFFLYSQLIEPLATPARVPQFEILLRGIDDDNNPVAPDEFMSHAEHYRLMPALDRWVVRHSLEMLSEFWTETGRVNSVFAINLSGQSLCENGFLDFVIGELARTKVPSRFICFEVTETAAILNMSRARQFMAVLRRKGCRFSLDDFGAGLSSFAYLKTLPIDYLKIDGQFVRQIVDDPVSTAMVAAINQMGHAMGLKTIGEFAESDAITERLKSVGTDYAQGYGIARPKPLSEQLDSLAATSAKVTG